MVQMQVHQDLKSSLIRFRDAILSRQTRIRTDGTYSTSRVNLLNTFTIQFNLLYEQYEYFHNSPTKRRTGITPDCLTYLRQYILQVQESVVRGKITLVIESLKAYYAAYQQADSYLEFKALYTGPINFKAINQLVYWSFTREKSPLTRVRTGTCIIYPARMFLNNPQLEDSAVSKVVDTFNRLRNFSYPEPLVDQLNRIIQFWLKDLNFNRFRLEFTNGGTLECPASQYSNSAVMKSQCLYYSSELGAVLEAIDEYSSNKFSAASEYLRYVRAVNPVQKTEFMNPYIVENYKSQFSSVCIDADCKTFPKGSVARLTFVPKNATSLRGVSSEETARVCISKGIQTVMYDYFKSHKLLSICMNLNNQSHNQRLIQDTLDYATVDLSAASDSVSFKLAKAVFKGTALYKIVENIHTKYLILPNNKLIDNVAFGAMGHPLTFSVESLIFASIVVYTMWRYENPGKLFIDEADALKYKDWGVYGDDIVVKNIYYNDLCQNLEALGFIVNKDKSFSSGSYRETCGIETYKGEDATSFKASRSLDLDGFKFPMEYFQMDQGTAKFLLGKRFRKVKPREALQQLRLHYYATGKLDKDKRLKAENIYDCLLVNPTCRGYRLFVASIAPTIIETCNRFYYYFPKTRQYLLRYYYDLIEACYSSKKMVKMSYPLCSDSAANAEVLYSSHASNFQKSWTWNNDYQCLETRVLKLKNSKEEIADGPCRDVAETLLYNINLERAERTRLVEEQKCASGVKHDVRNTQEYIDEQYSVPCILKKPVPPFLKGEVRYGYPTFLKKDTNEAFVELRTDIFPGYLQKYIEYRFYKGRIEYTRVKISF